jgi:hypothetical protein
MLGGKDFSMPVGVVDASGDGRDDGAWLGCSESPRVGIMVGSNDGCIDGNSGNFDGSDEGT